MKKAMLALAATSVIALSACGTSSSSDKVVTSKAGDITKEDFYTQMKQQYGKQVLNNMVMEKVLIKTTKSKTKM